MESEILEQVEVLEQNANLYLKAFDGLKERPFELILLAARGSSDHAALYARYLIEIHLQIPVCLAAPSVLTRYKSQVKYPKCLAIGISQSGEAPDVAEVLSYMRSNGHTTLGITNSPGSRITQEAEFNLLLNVGKERAVAATKTYSASLLAMYQLVRALGGDVPEPELPDETWLEHCQHASHEALGSILRSSTLFCLSRGYSFCTAQETALKLMECALLPCKSYSLADFQHGPKALAGHGSAAIVYGTPPDEIEDQGCLVTQAPHRSDRADAPISEIIFGQYLALGAARARGLDPDDPRFITKVTRTL